MINEVNSISINSNNLKNKNNNNILKKQICITRPDEFYQKSNFIDSIPYNFKINNNNTQQFNNYILIQNNQIFQLILQVKII